MHVGERTSILARRGRLMHLLAACGFCVGRFKNCPTCEKRGALLEHKTASAVGPPQGWMYGMFMYGIMYAATCIFVDVLAGIFVDVLAVCK